MAARKVQKFQVDYSLEVIGPKEAEDLLTRMPHNKKLMQVTVDKFARMMREGEWNPNVGEPIRVSTENNLIDGQHRMWAIVETGISIEFMVYRNAPPETIYDIDTGTTRTLATFLDLNGEKNPKELSPAIQLVMVHEETVFLYPGFRGRKTRAPKECLAFLEQHPEIRDHLKAARLLKQRFGGGAIWPAIRYALSKIDLADTEFFLEHVKTGEELEATSPIFQLRKRLGDHIRSTKKIGMTEYSALVIKAWNLFRGGKTISVLGWRPGGASPEPFPVPE